MNDSEKTKEIFQKYLDGEITEEEKLMIEEFIAKSDFSSSDLDNILYKNWLEQSSEREQSIGVLQEFKNIKRKIIGPKKVTSFSFLVKVAACILFIGFSFMSYRWYQQKITSSNSQWSYIEKATRKGEYLKVQLPDSSLVYLSTNSKLKWPSTFKNSKTREVFLEGEAFFEVEKNPNKPFIIRSGALVTQVLGTSFNISAFQEDQQHTVFVKTGKVSVSSTQNGGTRLLDILLPGQKLTYDIHSNLAKVDSIGLENNNDWLNRRLVFKKATIAEVMKQLERYYPVSFQFDESLIKSDFKFNAKFDRMDIHSILDHIKLMSNNTIKTKKMVNGKIKIWREEH